MRYLLLCLLLTASTAMAMEPETFQARYDAAEALAADSRPRAVAAHLLLAEETNDPEQQSKCLRRAAMHQFYESRQEPEVPLAIADRIPLPGVALPTRLYLLMQYRKWEQVIQESADADFSHLPEERYGLISLKEEAYRMRGLAAYYLETYEQAIKDLTRAGDLMSFDLWKSNCYEVVGHCWRKLGNDERALAAYRQAEAASRRQQNLVPVLSAIAEVYHARGEHEQAVAELRKLDAQAIRANPHGYALPYFQALGSALAQAGQYSEAVAAYQEILQMRLSDRTREQIESRIRELLMQQPGALVLAVEGHNEYQIVIPDDITNPTIDQLLVELGDLVAKAFAANDFELPVVRESQRDAERPGIFIGATELARQHVEIEQLEGWSYVHKVVGRDLIITGHDVPSPVEVAGLTGRFNQPLLGARMGTIKAVTDFLRVHLRARFLYPNGETGIEFLPLPAVTIPDNLDTTVTPVLRFCSARTWGRYGATPSLVAGRDLYSIANNYFPITDTDWRVHNYSRAIPEETYRESHPEYFALIGGKRVHDDDYCISNPAVQELIYQDMLTVLDQGYTMANLGQQDGFNACQCEPCNQLYGTDTPWRDKLWMFHRDLAERLQKERPGSQILALAYDRTWLPPETFRTFPDNTIILLTRIYDEWTDIEAPGGFGAYLYNWGTYNAQAYTPKRTPVQIGEQVRRFHQDFGVKTIYLDGFGTAFGLEGPVYYVFGRLWDAPDTLTVADLLEEYYEAAYGPAAGPMRRFFGRLHQSVGLANELPAAHTDAYGRRLAHFRGDPMRLMRIMYPVEVLQELDGFLREAEQVTVSPKVERRLALARLEFDYLRHIVTVSHLHQAYLLAPDLESRERLLTAIDHWHAFLNPFFRRNDDDTGWRSGMRSGIIDGWPEFKPFSGHSRHAVALTHSRHGAAYAETPLNWDTNQIRQQPLASARQLQVVRVDSSPTLASDIWEDVPGGELRERLGSFPPVKPMTRLQAVYDQTHLYMKITSELGDASPVTGPLTDSNSLAATEHVTVAIDPTGNRQILYRFASGLDDDARYSGAVGLIEDMVHPLYGKEDPSWNGDWEAETRLADGQWQALLRIPFASLGAEPPSEGTTWRANVARTHAVANQPAQRSIWSGTTQPSSVLDRESLGHLLFIGDPPIHPIRQRREGLYQETFAIPPDWQELPGLLPQALGTWTFRMDPANLGESRGWHEPEMSDSDWREVAVPSFWAETWINDYLGHGWYRCQLQLPDDVAGDGLRLHFGAVDEQAWVYVNGQLVGEHSIAATGASIIDLWDQPFSVEVPAELLVANGPNMLAVRVHNSTANGGIWRPVLVQHLTKQETP